MKPYVATQDPSAQKVLSTNYISEL